MADKVIIPVECPHCDNGHNLEWRAKNWWWCPSCHRTFYALTKSDYRLLKALRISSS